MRYPSYPKLRRTDISHIGSIPSHWSLSRIKHIAKLTPKKPKIDRTQTCSFIPMEKLKTDSLILNEERIIDDVYEGYTYFSDGDILMAKVTPCFENGNIALAHGMKNKIGFGSSEIYTIRPSNQIAGRFLFYRLQEDGFIRTATREMTGAGGLRRVPSHIIENFCFAAPHEPEQTQIANFLDRETAKIDALIEKQQQLIKLLEEKRQAVVSHAVTKGLNPNAKMKDSGAEWLGEVPEHWLLLKTKRFFRLVAEPATKNNDAELLSIYTEIGVRPRKDLEAKGNKASTTDGYWIVEKGDLIVNKLLAWMGATGYSAYDGVTSPAYDILRPTKDVSSKFYHYLFRSKIAQAEFKRWSRGIMEMRLRLYFDELGRITMPVPPRDEQDKIVARIEEIEQKYDQLESKSQSSIELLKERRAALISAAVTGKIDVRNAV
ncbi:restriction endonuclease subunit S [Bacterioplanes sanyensis]|uniref:Restriction endonuclease subunit S n=1 Tax=Bacterioplanes sanyensis TaxID=1249553 RepID=A0A222FKM6_9GAMM|nr:restriction endonuclease subunit S [Bacterioplanes sanyensis]ASP39597.1 restriction endonuclease subunit S [Bacterioplanes sanyensis]